MKTATTIFMRFLHFATWATQRATLGAQIALLDGQNILLVKHVYKPGWHLPGGGIDPPEDPGAAAVRELFEETGYRAGSLPELLAFLPNITRATKRDYVAIFRSSSFDPPVTGHRRSKEIKELGWFALTDLPEGTDNLTRIAVGKILAKVTVTERGLQG